MKKTVPEISIIIPMYNVEKYVGECLDSILVQTFTDYEVIIVDDCSTDKSYKIVESYLPKFNKFGTEKLRLIDSRKNSGGAATPRNIGLNLSYGEYILFVDSDDALTKTALEEMYKLAKNFDADVVYCEKFFRTDSTVKDIHLQKNLALSYGEQHGGYVDKPTLETVDLPLLVRNFCSEFYEMFPWDKLIRRNILIDNNIRFPHLRVYDDFIWTFKVFCNSKKIVRAPIATYIYRYNASSITSNKGSDEKNITFWMGSIIDGLKILDDFMSELKIFQDDHFCRYLMLNFFAHLQFKHIHRYSSAPPEYINWILNQHNAEKLGDHTVLISYLLSLITAQQKLLPFAYMKIKELQKNSGN